MNFKVQHYFHKSLSNESSPHPHTYFFKTHFNEICPSTPVSPKWVFLLFFPTKILRTYLTNQTHATRLTHLNFLELMKTISYICKSCVVLALILVTSVLTT